MRKAIAALVLLVGSLASASTDPTDAGIVFSMNGAGTGTYSGRSGLVYANGTLSSSYPAGDMGVGFSYVQIGGAQGAKLHVVIGRASGGTATVKCQARRTDTNNPGTFSGWAPVQTVRSDTAAPSFEHAILTTDSTNLFLNTADQFLTGDFRCIAKMAAAAAAGDSIVLGLNAR